MSAMTARIAIFLALLVVIDIFYFHLQHSNIFTTETIEKDLVGHDSDQSRQPSEEMDSAGLEDDAKHGIVDEIKNDAKEEGKEEDKDEDFVIDETGWAQGFVGSSESTLISIDDGRCQCELLSIDCLNTIECVVVMKDKSPQSHVIYQGMVKRETIKEMANYLEEDFSSFSSWYPIGKSFQVISKALFREWMKRNKLWKALGNRHEEPIDDKTFDFCVTNSLQGRRCVIKEFKEPEEIGEIEEIAIKRHGNSTEEIKALKTQYKSDLLKFRKNGFGTSPYEYLLLFSHFSRIGFNLRSHILDVYRHREKTIPTSSSEQENDILRVALHVRRGDSCGHSLNGYEKEHSPLDSVAQVSGIRMCYETSVYMDALSRIQSLAKGRHLVVYVATDHLLDLMSEIEKDHSKLYRQCTWKYVHHSRDIFNYSHTLSGGSKFIEFSANHGALGETALMDIWHLSHGEVFVGHLGSRFGKLSWWQAIARHNTFVPFFTVDGHSVCCDIDEACERVAPAITSMENCLTFSRDETEYKTNATEYWQKGSFVRYQLAADEIEYRKNLDPSYQPPKSYKSTY
eukprot:CAMPEP_0178897402 /NCGR_PEP_ID=MMETSP0786-20121207/1724_1 /TAXON_ID=186022 /ORGANISM="Thalassionema frauenfeldii, Strain CCMP 1798" /LENGTH=568 /DNA_ID=CAMNT_0020567943 /DNA_START=17 /DNA_END=1723 /DNA_ORIENTATION=+